MTSPSAPSQAHFRAAGFALAHALGSVEGGGPLVTLAFLERADGAELVRYEADQIAESIAGARLDLRERLRGGGHAALVYDGYATIENERLDAMIVELVSPEGDALISLVQPYRPARLGGAFGMLRTRGLPLPGGVAVIGQPITEGSIAPDASEALTRGLADHPSGRRLYRLPTSSPGE